VPSAETKKKKAAPAWPGVPRVVVFTWWVDKKFLFRRKMTIILGLIYMHHGRRGILKREERLLGVYV
jgi:hypothetical protein